MSSKTKIVVLRMKEIIYTAIFIGLAIFLILLFFFMFRSEKEAPAPTAESVSPAVYAPGVYSASLSLGRQNVNVEVAVSPDRISAVTLVPLSDSVAAMYPLMQPSMDALSAQILESQSLEGLEYPAGSQYTSMALMNAIKTAVAKAALPKEAPQKDLTIPDPKVILFTMLAFYHDKLLIYKNIKIPQEGGFSHEESKIFRISHCPDDPFRGCAHRMYHR